MQFGFYIFCAHFTWEEHDPDSHYFFELASKMRKVAEQNQAERVGATADLLISGNLSKKWCLSL